MAAEDTIVPNFAEFPKQFSPDSSSVVSTGNEGTIWLVDSDGSNLRQLAEGHGAAWQPQP
jgi:hypothetical protein